MDVLSINFKLKIFGTHFVFDINDQESVQFMLIKVKSDDKGLFLAREATLTLLKLIVDHKGIQNNDNDDSQTIIIKFTMKDQ